tara:strand:+ start:3456 stop:5576 length:2121 start_codon:yes stop_codon:yes gene_type:complete
MAYNTSEGPREIGDLKNEEDTDTQIDWSQDKISFLTNNIVRFVIDNSGISIPTGMVFSGPAANLVTSGYLKVSGSSTLGTDGADIINVVGELTASKGGYFGGNIKAVTGGSTLVLDVDTSYKANPGLWADGTHLVLGSVANNDLLIYLNNTETLQITKGTNVVSYTSHGGTGDHKFVGNVGIGVSDPDEKLEVSGAIHISAELGGSDIPSTPAANDGGVLYGKEDGKLYYKSDTVSETDLTAAGSGISFNGSTANGIVTYGGATTADVESNLTFNGSLLSVTGDIFLANDNDVIGRDDGSTRYGNFQFNSTETRFRWGGTDRVTFLAGGNVGIGVTDPDTSLEISGAIHISAELGGGDVPSTPAANDGGVLYGKEDGKIYWKSNTVAETDLTAGGSGGTPAGSDTQVQFNDGGSFGASSNLTWDDTTLTATGLDCTGNTTLGDASGDSVTINAATINIANVAAGTDNTVLVYNGSTIVHDEIDSRVWGSTLVDATGTPADDQIAVWTDANTAEGTSNLTFGGSILKVVGNLSASGNANFVGHITGSGDLRVSGSIRGKQIHVTEHAFQIPGTAEYIIPFYNATQTTTSNADMKNQWVVPFNGALKRAYFRGHTGITGDVKLRLLTASIAPGGAGNVGVGELDNPGVRCAENQTKGIPAQNYNTVVYPFTGSQHFQAGEIVGMTVQAASSIGDTNLTLVWELDVFGI